jgi:hypothetical protein
MTPSFALKTRGIGGASGRILKRANFRRFLC